MGSDEEIEKKFTEIAKPATIVPDLNIVKEEKKAEEVLVTEKQDKKVVRNLNFDDDIFKEEFIDNTPVQDEIEQITYKKDESSRRFRDSNKPKQKKVHNPKKDRRKMISSLFSDSDGDLPSTSSKKLSFKDNKEPRAVTPSSEESRTPTPTTSLRSELEEKKERMKKKLKRSGGDVEDPRVLEYKKKKKQMQESTPRKNHSSGSTPSKVHTCNGSCMCIKNIRHDEDNKWLVDDAYESSDERVAKSSESDESSDNVKPDQSSSQKKKIILKKRIIPAEDSSDEDTDEDEDAEDRRKRLDDRKKRKRVRKQSPAATFPVEEVVWTPAMYEKWDKNRGKKGDKYDSDSDAPRSKHKKLNRSLSSEPKPSNDGAYKHHKSSHQPKVQRSMSSLESLGIAHNSGPSSMTKPATSLPKIPKLKKPDQGKL